MDPFLTKLSEYGLVAIDEDAYIINDIKDHLSEYGWGDDGFEIIMNALYGRRFRMVLFNKSVFEKKFNISKEESEKFKKFLHEALVDVNGYDDTLRLEKYNVEKYTDDSFETHVENNYDFYENWLPDWKLKRKFNKEKTEQDIFEKVNNDFGEFYQKFDRGEETKNFVVEMKRASRQLNKK